MLTGAVIAVGLKRPELAIPLALLSHFVLDAIPHFGFDEEDVLVPNKTKLFKAVITTDTTAAVVALIALPILAHAQPWTIFASMLAAFSPDLVWIYRFFDQNRHQQNKSKGRFVRFHKSIQWSETRRGIHVEYMWAVGMLLLFSLAI